MHHGMREWKNGEMQKVGVCLNDFVTSVYQSALYSLYSPNA